MIFLNWLARIILIFKIFQGGKTSGGIFEKYKDLERIYISGTWQKYVPVNCSGNNNSVWLFQAGIPKVMKL